MGFGCGNDNTRWGFADVLDWLESVILSFPAPWAVAELDGKYYGTIVKDARGVPILSFWMTEGQKPSVREKGDMTDAEWSEYCCDSHWESAAALVMAEKVVSLRNIIAIMQYGYDSKPLISMIIEHGRWEEDVDDEIKCGGPDRRQTSYEHDTIDPLAGMSSSYRDYLKIRKSQCCPKCGELRKAVPRAY